MKAEYFGALFGAMLACVVAVIVCDGIKQSVIDVLRGIFA